MTAKRQADTTFPDSFRVTILLAFFLFWSFAIVVRLTQFMIFQRDRLITEMEQDASFEGVIPAMRGSLVDADGDLLSWSSRHFTLSWAADHAPATAPTILKALRNAGLEFVSGSDTVGGTAGPPLNWPNIDPETALALTPTVRRYKSLTLKAYFVRHTVADPALRDMIGDTALVNGVEVGISGAEKKHDALLRGRAGMYRVMLDKNGNWISDTWEQTRSMRAGYTVYLPFIDVPAAIEYSTVPESRSKND